MCSSIVVGTDGSHTAQEAVRQAIQLAKQHGASLKIVSAYQPVSSSRLRTEHQKRPTTVKYPNATYPETGQQTRGQL